jgi:hypothetical protein
MPFPPLVPTDDLFPLDSLFPYGGFLYGLSAVVEFSDEPLSASPSWTDVSQDVMEMEWWAGRASDLDEPSPGGMSIRIRDQDGHWIPGADIDTDHRFRLVLTDAIGEVPQGVWYVEEIQVENPTRDGDYAELVVSCVDGMGILAQDPLPHLEPEEASSYEDVIAFDEPSFYYRLGEPAGTKLIHHVRRKRKRREHESKRHYKRHGYRHWTTKVTRAEAEGMSGPAGDYKNRPTLAQPGLVLGDPATCVHFNAASSEYAAIALSAEDTVDRNALTIEALINLDTIGGNYTIAAGPYKASITATVWNFHVIASGKLRARVELATGGTPTLTTTGTATLAAGTTYHVAMRWDSFDLNVYINGALDATASVVGETMRTGDTGEYLRIGADKDGGGITAFFNGYIDEFALIEDDLDAARIADHYTAARERGFPVQLTGDRIAQVATDPLWSTAGIAAGQFEMNTRMMTGQPRLEAITEAVNCELPRAHFYFDGEGNPVYLDFSHTDASVEDFGNGVGQTPYRSMERVYDNEVFNQISGSVDGGETITVEDATSIAARKTKKRDEELGLPLEDEADVTTILNTILDTWKNPVYRVASVSITGTDADRIDTGLRRQIGETVTVHADNPDGSTSAHVGMVMGWRKSISAQERILTVTYDLSRWDGT